VSNRTVDDFDFQHKPSSSNKNTPPVMRRGESQLHTQGRAPRLVEWRRESLMPG
jgi:hypothetical protein